MSSYDQSVTKHPDSTKSTKNKDDLHDEAITGDHIHLQSTDQTRRSSNRGPDSSDQGSVSKTPGQGDSESEKGSPGAPQTSSNQPKAKASQPSQGPELLLIKLQEKANIQFPEDRKRDVSSNAASQLNSIATLLEGGDLKSKNKISYNQPINFGFNNPLLNPNNPELFYSLYVQSQLTNLLPVTNIPYPQITDKPISQLYAQTHDKFLNGRDQTIQTLLQSQNLSASASNLTHANEDNDKDHNEAGRGVDQEDKGLNAGRLASVHSSESKTNLAKEQFSHLQDDNVLDISKNGKGLSAKKKKLKQCFNKLCNADPADLNIWTKVKVKNMAICKPCHEAYKKEQYCCYCQQIYLDLDGYSTDDKGWIACETCSNWVHIECEEELGQIKNLKYLAEREKNYKYYCPTCRVDKNKMAQVKGAATRPATKTSTRNSSARPQSGSLNPYQRQFASQRRQSQKSQAHSKPALDDKLSLEEFIEEPAVKKVKIIEPIVEIIEAVTIQQQLSQPLPQIEIIKEILPVPVKNPDIAKLKLDSMFNRNAKKKLVKPVTTTVDAYNDIDKLMSQYAGKRVQLTELEINIDLAKIREICTNYSYLDRNYHDMSYNNYDHSDNGSVDEKVNGKSKRRFTEQRKSTKGRGKNFYNEADMFYDEDTSESAEGHTNGHIIRKANKHKPSKYDY